MWMAPLAFGSALVTRIRRPTPEVPAWVSLEDDLLCVADMVAKRF